MADYLAIVAVTRLVRVWEREDLFREAPKSERTGLARGPRALPEYRGIPQFAKNYNFA